MNESFVKLYAAILRSTVWVGRPLHVKVTWITMLVLSDANGDVAASIPGLAHEAGVSPEQCEEALKLFLEPDAYSRTKAHDGRRIVEIDGGWHILNHQKYVRKRSRQQVLAAERQARWRDEKRAEKAAKRSRSGRASANTERYVSRKSRPYTDTDLDLGDPRGAVSKDLPGNARATDSNDAQSAPEPPAPVPEFEVVQMPRQRLHDEAEVVHVERIPTVASRQVPETWQPLERHRARAVEQSVDFDVEVRKFRETEFNRTYSNWNLRFDKWLSEARTRGETERFQRSQRGGQRPLVLRQPNEGRTGFERIVAYEDDADDGSNVTSVTGNARDASKRGSFRHG